MLDFIAIKTIETVQNLDHSITDDIARHKGAIRDDNIAILILDEGIVAICVEELVEAVSTGVSVIAIATVENISKWSSNQAIVSGTTDQGDRQLICCTDLNAC